MSLLQVITDKPGYLKATLQGPQGSGKTRTAVELAAVAHKHFGSKKPIAFFDTETGSDYVAHLIRDYTGMESLRVKTRAFADLSETLRECLEGAADVLIVDSITHVWRELQDGYMKKVNAGRRYQKTRMDIQDIMAVKKLWEPWPDTFLQSPLHIVVCGREGAEWGTQEDEESGKRELVQTGKKMKVESEFGYEASLMIAMSAEQVPASIVKIKGGKGKTEKRPRRLVNVATILKDRFDTMNGQAFEMPTGETFLPFLRRLTPGNHGQTDMSVKSDGQLPELDDNGWNREKRRRVELAEEIQGELLAAYPGQSAAEKRAKGELVKSAFGTYSWAKVEGLPSEQLTRGLEVIRGAIAEAKAGAGDDVPVIQAA